MIKKLIMLLCVGTVWTLAAQTPKPDAPAIPAVPNFSPGPEYADGARMFQGIPGIERGANGRLWATWYGGGVTEDQHNYILLHTSGDDGKSWQPVLVLDPDGAGPVRAFDPGLWRDSDGKLWLFWAQEKPNKERSGMHCFAITTTDSGNGQAVWSAPRRIGAGVMMNKPTVTRDGRWLLPLARWFTDGSCGVVVSTDHGVTFSALGAANIPDPKSRNADEHMLVERKDGSLWMLARGIFRIGDGVVNGLGESVSSDGGKTWSNIATSPIQLPTTRFFIRKLASGRLLMVYRIDPVVGKQHSLMAAFLSEDDGSNWKGGLLLDNRFGANYPDGVQAPDGSIYVIYDYQRWRDKEILMAVFTEADVLAGKLTSPNSRLRVLVNKATGVNAKAAAAPVVNLDLNPNTNGVALLAGPAAVMDNADGQTDAFTPGAKIFLDRNYTVRDVPAALRGFQFTRKNLDVFHAVCRQAGVMYVISPSTGRDPFSLEAVLLERSFQKVNLPEFPLFSNVRCSVFQKQVAAGEVLDFPRWGVLVVPQKDSK